MSQHTTAKLSEIAEDCTVEEIVEALLHALSHDNARQVAQDILMELEEGSSS
jgi:alkylhydroperoxidase/carboxymuconolactone decarboxylase family protein YurZ